MTKTLFVDDSTERIDLGEGFWVEILSAISLNQSEKVFQQVSEEKVSKIQVAKKMLVVFIKKWNICEEGGEVAEINEKNIGRLPMKIITRLSELVEPKMNISKKKLPTSSEQLKETN